MGENSQKNIDIHAHIIPDSFIKMIENNKLEGISFKYGEDGSISKIVFEDGSMHPYTEAFYSTKKRLEIMDSYKNDIQVLSITPRLFFYHLSKEAAIEANKAFNNDISKLVKQYPHRFMGMGSVPLQDIDAAIEELCRMKAELGFNSVQIGTFVNGKNISGEEFIPFYKKAAELEMLIFIHPLITNDLEILKQFHLSNLVGNPFQTTTAITNLIFSGMFEKIPQLKVVLAHGGGFLPYQLGRLKRGYEVRPEAKVNISKEPGYYVMNNIYFDGLTHSLGALKYLVEEFGADRVMFGTDYPYDMGEYDQLDKIAQLDLSQAEVEKIIYQNAGKILKRI